MNPSRAFILRPVATSLLMVELLLVGAVGYKQLSVSALPQVDYSTIQIVTFIPEQRRCHDFIRDCATGTPAWTTARP